jgi:hypothetical protein
MRWWRRIWRRAAGSLPRDLNRGIRLTLPGWNEGAPDQETRMWHDSDGDALSLDVRTRLDYPLGSDEMTQRRWCREIAEWRGGGLIEMHGMVSGAGASVRFIYKRMQVDTTGYVYTGMFIASAEPGFLIWTIVAGERSTSGLREAIVTASLMKSGKLTLENYEQCWAQDPYEPAYHGVDRIVLRFMSDDETYDQQFPWHPLSKVRHVLALLPSAVQFDSQRP